MKKLFIHFFFSLFYFGINAQCAWRPMGSDVSNQPANSESDYSTFAVAPNGDKYVAYLEWNQGNQLIVKKYDGTMWSYVGTAAMLPANVQDACMSVGGDGVPYIIYTDNGLSIKKFDGLSWVDAGNLSFFSNTIGETITNLGLSHDTVNNILYAKYGIDNGMGFSDLNVVKLNGNNWSYVGGSNFTIGYDDMWESVTRDCFKISPDGTPYLAFIEEDMGDAGYGVSVKKFDGANWVYVGDSLFGWISPGSVRLDFSTTGQPLVCWKEGSSLNVMELNSNIWTFVGNYDITVEAWYYFSFAVGPDNTPYIAFDDHTLPALIGQPLYPSDFCRVSVMKYNGSNWVYVNNQMFTELRAKYVLIDFDNLGELNLSYLDDASPVGWGYVSKVVVKKYSSGSWEPVGDDGFSTYLAYNHSCTTSPGGNVYSFFHINYPPDAMTEPNNGPGSVMKFNGSDWELVGDEGFVLNVRNPTSIAVDSNETPYVAFKNNNTSKPDVLSYNGISWNYVGAPGISSGTVGGDYVDITIGDNNEPYVVFSDQANGGKASVMRFNGTSWVYVGSPGFSPGSVDYSCMAITSDGIPYVAFKDNANGNKTTVMIFDGLSWSIVGTPGFSGGAVFGVSLVMDHNGNPNVVYSNAVVAGDITVMKYDGLNWTLLGGATLGVTAYYDDPSLVFDSSNTAYVAYKDNDVFGVLNVKYCNGGIWQDLGSGTSTPSSCFAPKLGINSENKLYMVFQNNKLFAQVYDNAIEATVSSNIICEGEPVLFNVSAAAAYSWSGPNSFSSTQQQFTLSNTDTLNSGIYTVSIYDSLCGYKSANLNLTVKPNQQITVSGGTICNGDTFAINPSGADTYAYSDSSIVSPITTSTYTVVGTHINGCSDSATVLVTVVDPSSSFINQTACDSYTLNSQMYDSSGTYLQTIPNAMGCDSVITLQLIINNNPLLTTTVNETTITANETGGTYQWVDCTNGNAIITGETNQIFTALVNGNYAVIVSNGNCTDTSVCVNISSVGLRDQNTYNNHYSVSPNPNNGIFTINGAKNTHLEVCTVEGKKIMQFDVPTDNYTIDAISLEPGIYYVLIMDKGICTSIKLIKI